MTDRAETLERWKLAYAEVRGEVTLGWDRAKTFMTLNAALPAGIGSFTTRPELARIALTVAMLTAVTGAMVVYRGHKRYRHARNAFMLLENRLGFDDLQTTGGQRVAREGLRLESYKVTTAVVTLCLLAAAFDLIMLLRY